MPSRFHARRALKSVAYRRKGQRLQEDFGRFWLTFTLSCSGPPRTISETRLPFTAAMGVESGSRLVMPPGSTGGERRAERQLPRQRPRRGALWRLPAKRPGARPGDGGAGGLHGGEECVRGRVLRPLTFSAKWRHRESLTPLAPDCWVT